MTTSDENALRSFVYIDEYLLQSLSSQLFGGVTELSIHVAGRAEAEAEEQKGPVGSGRKLSDVLRQHNRVEERRVLYDHAYNLFEEELLRRGAMADAMTVQEVRDAVERGVEIVRVSGGTTVNDYATLADFMAQYNSFGEALARVQTHGDVQRQIAEINEQLAHSKEGGVKRELRARLKALGDIQSIAKNSNMWMDDEFRKSLEYLIRQSYGDEVELALTLPEETGGGVTAILERNYMRRGVRALVRKYSRRAQSDFTVVGVVTRVGSNDTGVAIQNAESPSSMREAVQNIIYHLGAVEDTFFAAHDDEVVLDPIAVYRVLRSQSA